MQTQPQTKNYFVPPTECPDCNHPLVMDGEYLVCRGDNCGAQVAGKIKRWVKKIGVLHFGEALIEALIDAGMVETIGDLYRVDPKVASSLYMGGRRVGGTADRGFKNLHKKANTELDLHVIVGSLGIPFIGRGMARMIVDGGFDTLQLMLQSKPHEIAAIPGVGLKRAESFKEGFLDNLWIISDLLKYITVKRQVDGPLKGLTFCLTGFRDKALSDAIEAMGGIVKSGVSKKLTHLVLINPNSTTGKAQKARKYNDAGQASIDLIDPATAWALTGQVKP